MIEIDLGQLTKGGEVRNLSGHERGVAARKHFHLDEADQSDEEVLIHIPEEIYALTPSFFQGMFAESVHAAGNDRGRFLARFRFAASPIVLRQIDRGISSVRTRRGDVFAN